MAVFEEITTDVKDETIETLYGDERDESLDDILIYDVINLYQSQGVSPGTELWSLNNINPLRDKGSQRS